jgi:hypothetical protein
LSSPLSSRPGLTTAEAQRRRLQFGPNATVSTDRPGWRVLVGKFIAPVPCLLEAAIILQLVLGEYFEAGIIGLLLLFNAVLGAFQEGRAQATLQALKERLALNAAVLRDGAWTILPAAELVPGATARSRRLYRDVAGDGRAGADGHGRLTDDGSRNRQGDRAQGQGVPAWTDFPKRSTPPNTPCLPACCRKTSTRW